MINIYLRSGLIKNVRYISEGFYCFSTPEVDENMQCRDIQYARTPCANITYSCKARC